ncbi:MAG TPA: hypothetical protein VH880_10540 [Anaeromyxobacteraceae bacterium]
MTGPALLALAIAAAGPDLRAELSRASVRLGEPFELALALRHEPGEAASLAPLPPLEPFALREAGCRTVAGDRSALTTCELALQLLDLGDHVLPPVAVVVRGPAGERRAEARGLRVRALGVTDPAVPAASLPLREPAAPPVEVPRLAPLAWAGGLLAALALAILAVRLWRRRRSRVPAPPPLPPDQRFARRLAEILALELPARGRGREHVERLAEAVRDLLAALAPGAALDLTSAELLAALGARPLSGVDLGALRAFLELADLVKFARHEPPAEACAAASRYAAALGEAARPPATPREAA